jgi:hypothetical protein
MFMSLMATLSGAGILGLPTASKASPTTRPSLSHLRRFAISSFKAPFTHYKRRGTKIKLNFALSLEKIMKKLHCRPITIDTAAFLSGLS